MKIRFIHFVAFSFSILGTAAMGCVTETVASGDGTDTTTEAEEGDSAMDQSPEAEPEAWDSKCCHFKCTYNNNVEYWNSNPVYGQCVNFAEYYCASNHHGAYKSGSAYWGSC